MREKLKKGMLKRKIRRILRKAVGKSIIEWNFLITVCTALWSFLGTIYGTAVYDANRSSNTSEEFWEAIHNLGLWHLIPAAIIVIMGAQLYFYKKIHISTGVSSRERQNTVTKYLDTITDLFKIISSASLARAKVFIHRESCFYSVAHSSGHMYEEAKEYGSNELVCFDAYHNECSVMRNLTDEEKEKSGNAQLKSILAITVFSTHYVSGEKIGVLQFDIDIPIEDCKFNENHNAELWLSEIARFISLLFRW